MTITKIRCEEIKTVLSDSNTVCDWYLKVQCDKLKVNFRKPITMITNKTERWFKSKRGHKID